ncbi:MAG: M20 family metallopeptidase [Roseibium sp.]|uniref:M20 family metallopeptidase n=1 Tax=Roseibium sp. TaxID=1936156 RepID=UPI0026399145|nr:M20 family metallopeptidase [Roseibium sp.]MCV0425641.1 M20 family metallopeptidase [Roseibium sp.]
MNDPEINVDREGLLADLASMIRIPSVNCFGNEDPSAPSEGAMADYLETRLRDLAMHVESREVSNGRRNVWGRLKGTGNGPTVLLAGHLDTVGVEGYDAPFDPKIEHGRIYGRGSCDMKAGLAAFLEVVRLVRESGQQLAGDLIVAGVVDEEHAMVGSRDFGLSGPKVDFAIVAEPTNLAISPTHKGQICRSIRTKGVSVHSSVPDQGVNAILHMSLVLDELRQLATSLANRKPDPMCGNPTLSVGVIKGGTNVSSVPDWCEIEVDRRTIPGENLDSVSVEYQNILDRIASDQPDFQYELCVPGLNVDPFHTPLDSPIVTAITEACEDVTGETARVTAFTGSTDAPNFRCPAVICGAGSLEQCHSLNEYVEIDEIVAAVRIYYTTLQLIQTSKK